MGDIRSILTEARRNEMGKILAYSLAFPNSEETKKLLSLYGVEPIILGIELGANPITLAELIVDNDLGFEMCSYPGHINFLAIQLYNISINESLWCEELDGGGRSLSLMIQLLRSSFRTERDLFSISSSVLPIGQVDDLLIEVERAMAYPR
jgi:hypothetical protein